jgi:MSHA biogenesis protein MshP
MTHPLVRGFALIPALFLLVVLGMLAIIAVRIATSQQQTVTMSLAEARALAAAQAGIEWGAYQSLVAHQCAASTLLSLSEAALDGFSVTVTCSAQSFTNGASTVAPYLAPATATSYVLKSTATTGTYGQPGYVKRVVSATYSSAT